MDLDISLSASLSVTIFWQKVAIVAFFISQSTGNFNPFVDNEWCSIHWAGPASLTEGIMHSVEDTIQLTTADNEKYRCLLPKDREQEASEREKLSAEYVGLSAEELIRTRLQSCSYRLESYWNYELCHGKHLRQYHEQKDVGKDVQVQEFFLGYAKVEKKVEKTETSNADDAVAKPKKKVRTRRLDDVELPFFEVQMSFGTPCDLTKNPRTAKILYVCQPHGHGEVYSIKEISTCAYEVIVITQALCNHPDYKPVPPDVNQVNCHALDGAPTKPRGMVKMEHVKLLQTPEHIPTMPTLRSTRPDPAPAPAPVTETHGEGVLKTDITVQGSDTGKQLMRSFFAGEFCLKGGNGWWKHEVCYKNHIYQYHEDTSSGRTTIWLGHWDELAHKNWLDKNPLKKPRPLATRKVLSIYYGGGDVCDLTGRPRHIELKLKCKEDTTRPNAVSLYLSEPKPCEYQMVVESPVLCLVIGQADDYGLLHNPQF